MRGTAADMQIVENLALAKRRGLHRGLAWGVMVTVCWAIVTVVADAVVKRSAHAVATEA